MFTGRKTEESKPEEPNSQHSTHNDQTGSSDESSQSPQRELSSEGNPPKTRAAELMEMRTSPTQFCFTSLYPFSHSSHGHRVTGRKAAEAQAAVSAKRQQLAAQAAASNAKARESEQAIISHHERASEPSTASLLAGGEVKSSDVQSLCLMSYEDKIPAESRGVVRQPHHKNQNEEKSKKLMLGHFAHALAQIFGGSSSEAGFMSKAGFELDKLFRSFGRSKPGRGVLNFPEFTGALRHVVSKHDMDKRYVETDVVADLFMFCDGNSDGYVSDAELCDFLLHNRRARRKKMQQNSQVARRKQAPRFRGPAPRRGQGLPRARIGPKRRVKIAPGLGLTRGVRGGGVRGRRRRKPVATGKDNGRRSWIQQHNMARRRARHKAASVNTLHAQCASVARRLLAAQTLQGWVKAFCRYDRTRARCMQWREVRDRLVLVVVAICSCVYKRSMFIYACL